MQERLEKLQVTFGVRELAICKDIAQGMPGCFTIHVRGFSHVHALKAGADRRELTPLPGFKPPAFQSAVLPTQGFNAQKREEKQLELSLEALISQVADLKNSLVNFIYKLENEYDRLTWPSVLDNFALLSGQLNTLNKVLKHEKTPLLRNQVIIPLVLSPDRDEELMRQTEGRVPVFSHEVVPDHLRTKPDPEVEEQEKQLSTDAARIGADVAQKQIQSLNKMCSNLLEKINKEDRESESGGIRQNKQTFNPADTNALVAAVAFGKGLSNRRPPGVTGPVQSGQPGANSIIAGGSAMQQVQMPGAPGQTQPMLGGVQMPQGGNQARCPVA